MAKFIEKKLIEVFKNKESFSREELFDFLIQAEPDLKEGTFGWRIYDLKKREIIKPLRRGYYTISYKPKFKPSISSEIQKLAKQVSEKYKDIKYCIWDTQWLNDLTQHQSAKQIIIIETEKDFVESLYYHLKDNFNYNFYLNPDEKTINFYVSDSIKPIVIKKLITRAPTGKSVVNKTTIFIPVLEKILVDLFCDTKLFYFYQGSELNHIYENAVKNYSINFSKLFSYAGRREGGQDFKIYFSKHLNDALKDIMND